MILQVNAQDIKIGDLVKLKPELIEKLNTGAEWALVMGVDGSFGWGYEIHILGEWVKIRRSKEAKSRYIIDRVSFFDEARKYSREEGNNFRQRLNMYTELVDRHKNGSTIGDDDFIRPVYRFYTVQSKKAVENA
jgi:hypothetical protein